MGRVVGIMKLSDNAYLVITCSTMACGLASVLGFGRLEGRLGAALVLAGFQRQGKGKAEQ
jgi:hypothetical protein